MATTHHTITARKLHPLITLISSSALFVLSSAATGIAHRTLAFAPVTHSSSSPPPPPSLAWRCRDHHSHHPFHRRQHRRILSQRMSSSQHIMESPSAERNKGPIYDLVLSPIIFPQLIQQQQQQQLLLRCADNPNNNTKQPKIRVLELAAGCGVHTVHFVSSFLSSSSFSSSTSEEEEASKSFVDIEWHPSDPDLDARMSIDARVNQSNNNIFLSKYVLPTNAWILGTSGGTACGDGGYRDKDGNAGASQAGCIGNVEEYASYHDYFDLILCINMIHIAPWEATLGLMECAGKVLRSGGMLVCYGPFKVGGTAMPSNLSFDTSLRSKDSQWGLRNLEDVMDVAKKQGLEYVQKVDMPSNNLSVIFRKK